MSEPKKQPSRGGMIVVGLIALSGAFFAGRLLFVRHDSSPAAIAPGIKDLEENAWVIAKGHIDTTRLGRVSRLGSDIYVFPLIEYGNAFFVVTTEPPLADTSEHTFTGVIDIAGSGIQKPGVIEYRGTKVKVSESCRDCKGDLRALKVNDEPTGRALPLVGVAFALLFAFAAFRGAARKPTAPSP